MTELNVIDARPEHAEQVVDVIHQSFGARPVLDPPSTALDETVESVREALERDGGLLVERRGVPMGALLFDESRPGLLGLKRVSVIPGLQDRGVASAMVGVAEDVAEDRGKDGIWLHVREELPENVQFWSRRKYLQVDKSGTTLTFGKTLWLAIEAPTSDAMQAVADRVAGMLRAGDLLVLTGDLGAGKTTFTQGLGAALGVRGPVTSPTFVIARTHPSLVGGPALVHVDAYRLGGAAEVDDIDLDATADQAVTVVEWGEGLAEQLADSWLHITIEVREVDETRIVTIRPHGSRWIGVPLRSTILRR